MARRWANYDSFVECKTWGHAWDDYDSGQQPPRTAWRYREVLRCTRCSTIRTFYLDAEGNVVSRQYKYADGYRDAKGSEKPTRPEMRILIIKRKGR